MDTHLFSYLEKHGIHYTKYEHPAVFTVAESSKIILNPIEKHTKNLLLKDEKNQFYLICLAAEKRLLLAFLRKHLQIKELEFATPTELKEQLNVTPGSVSLFSIIYAKHVHLILDEDLWSAPLTGFHPNENTSTLIISHENLKKFYDSLPGKKEVITFA